MGRDGNKKGNRNKNSLPQTPKHSKILPDQLNEEFSTELTGITNRDRKNARKK
ncbi:YfhD family protein [Domibacillus mangrovi]|uniref:YfhD family protein n=1 Tax=Domibacillus mangrovi TaxID=1714354 RepID=UPI000AE8E371|nr:YfhD family protein [Domibacillus mangrovi]